MDYKAYTLKEVSEKLDIHITTLRGYVKSGKLKATKLGNKYIVSEDNYIDFVNGKGTNEGQKQWW